MVFRWFSLPATGPRFAAAGFLLALSTAAVAATPAVPALPPGIEVIDGDTVRIQGTKYRLWGIDAPELHQMCGVIACGQEAKARLTSLVTSGGINCREMSTDKYGRKVAVCRNNATLDLGAEMVHEGWAMDYTTYSRGEYMHFQSDARRMGAGMWSAPFVEEPWNWRKDHGK